MCSSTATALAASATAVASAATVGAVASTAGVVGCVYQGRSAGMAKLRVGDLK